MHPPRQYSRLSVGAALLVFPPLGFLLMYKDPHYHRRFAHLLYLSAFTPLLFYFGFSVFVIPQLTLLGQSLGNSFPPASSSLLLTLSLVSLLQFPLGLVLDWKIKTDTSHNHLLLWTIVVLIAIYILTSYTISMVLNSVLEPIYNLTTSLQ